MRILIENMKKVYQKLKQPTEQTNTSNTTKIILQDVSPNYRNPAVGDLAIKYEVGNRGVGYISNGSSWGDPGGDSYGPYQLETKKGTMQAYLKRNDKFTEALSKYQINSEDFKASWRALAQQDPNGFKKSQFDFLAEKKEGYYDAIDCARKLGWDVDNFALCSAIFSTSNQSGGWRRGIFMPSGINKNDDIKTQINKLYDARAAYFKKIKLPQNVRSSIIKSRTIDERKDCLKLI